MLNLVPALQLLSEGVDLGLLLIPVSLELTLLFLDCLDNVLVFPVFLAVALAVLLDVADVSLKVLDSVEQLLLLRFFELNVVCILHNLLVQLVHLQGLVIAIQLQLHVLLFL